MYSHITPDSKVNSTAEVTLQEQPLEKGILCIIHFIPYQGPKTQTKLQQAFVKYRRRKKNHTKHSLSQHRLSDQRICQVQLRKQLLEATNNHLSQALWMSRKPSLLSAGSNCDGPKRLQHEK